ncbi:MAG: succinylglutamate desuccinylase/aspartoacylase family protein [Caldiserica bacterium]|nr:succinylglutamate desuccinylase/aspartoacylase family protein [Caldisericota bacterium]
MKRLVISNLQVKDNTKVQGFLPVPGLPEGFWPGFFVIRGKIHSPILTVFGGIHGGEYSSIEAAKQLGQELLPEDLKGTLIICPIANLPAFFSRRVFQNPLDDKNLNRVFPGDPEGSASERLAYHLSQNLISPADIFIDLHGGDLVESLIPFTLFPPGPSFEIETKSRSLAVQFGIPRAIKAFTAGSAYCWAANNGKPAILAEAGQQGILSEEAVKLLKKGVYKVLLNQRILTEEAAFRFLSKKEPEDNPGVRIFLEEDWEKSPASGLWYPIISCGSYVKEGQVIGEIRDLFGGLLATVEAKHEGVVIFLLTSLAVNEGDSLLSIAHSAET